MIMRCFVIRCLNNEDASSGMIPKEIDHTVVVFELIDLLKVYIQM